MKGVGRQMELGVQQIGRAIMLAAASAKEDSVELTCCISPDADQTQRQQLAEKLLALADVVRRGELQVSVL